MSQSEAAAKISKATRREIFPEPLASDPACLLAPKERCLGVPSANERSVMGGHAVSAEADGGW
jgi:hypothetical protein